MKQTLDLVQRFDTVATVDAQVVDQAKEALRIWEAHIKNSFELPMREVFDCLTTETIDRTKLAEAFNCGEDTDIGGEYVFISREEMESLDPDEQVGLSLGNFVFVSDLVPQEYLPFVLLNLKLLASLKEDGGPVEKLKSVGVNVETAKHWTANFLDIAEASRVFGLDNPKFVEFLEWRKEAERTSFMNMSGLENELNRLKEYQIRRRSTHPSKRGKWNRHSWINAQVLASLPTQYQTAYRLLLSVNLCDYQVIELFKKVGFVPTDMFKLLQCIQDTTEEKYVDLRLHHRGSNVVKKAKRRVLKLEDSSLATQAELLTESSLSAGHLLEEDESEKDSYLIVPHANKTAAALQDRIAYFVKHALVQKFGQGLIRAFKSVDFTRGELVTGLTFKIQEMEGTIERINECTLGIETLRDSLQKLNPDNPNLLMPNAILENEGILAVERERMTVQLIDMRNLQEQIDDISARMLDLIKVIKD